MEVWEVLRAISTVVGPLAGVVIAVLGYLLKQRLEAMEASIQAEVRKREIEFASLRGRMETMGDEREAGDAKVHERVNKIETKLPNEYARQGAVASIERRMDNMQTEMKEGFRHQSTQIQQVLSLLKNGR